MDKHMPGLFRKTIILTNPFFLLSLFVISISCFAEQSEKNVFEMHKSLGRGINLGNALEAPKEGQWGVVLKEEYFKLIKEAGFDSVRIPIRWSAHALTEKPYTIEQNFFERVDWAVKNALFRGLFVIINMHNYDEIYENPKEHSERFLALWQQIAEHYSNCPEQCPL